MHLKNGYWWDLIFLFDRKDLISQTSKWDKKWDNPNREVRYDVDKMESGLEKPY